MADRFAPPGDATVVRAERVLVLAPHADDDILGCGGLLSQLARAGAEIRVLFLTDSSGGDEVVTDRRAYAARRHEEARRALEVLGIGTADHLEIPDGRLANHLDAASEAIAAAVTGLRPDLLLSVSPLEATSDHQAAFAALHRTLSPLRGGTELDEAVEGLRVLLYEVNRPGFPNLLVDVTADLPRLSDAIGEHASQLELHRYREAALGVRRYRALSLPATAEAAEGFYDLRPADFVTHGLAGLIRRLGGLPEVHEVTDGPRISVVVRTKDRPELLQEALASLAASSYRRVEVVLVNDGGQPPEVANDYPLPLVRVNLASNRGRAAAANAGVEASTGDWVAFLDDDDLAEPEHLATLAGLVAAAGVRLAYTDAAVGVYELDPQVGWRQVQRTVPYSRDFDPELLLFDNYIPFNTVLVERSLLREAGPFDPCLEFFEDWDMLIRLSAAARFHHHPQVTCEYRHFRTGGHVLGEQPWRRADFLQMKARILDRHRDRITPDVTARVVARLREEAVARSAEAGRLRSDHATLRDAYHRLHGELEGSKAHARQLDQTVRGLRDQESMLREVVTDQEDHLRRLYAEIERLNRLVAAMEGTKAWRLHRAIERLRGRGK